MILCDTELLYELFLLVLFYSVYSGRKCHIWLNGSVIPWKKLTDKHCFASGVLLFLRHSSKIMVILLKFTAFVRLWVLKKHNQASCKNWVSLKVFVLHVSNWSSRRRAKFRRAASLCYIKHDRKIKYFSSLRWLK